MADRFYLMFLETDRVLQNGRFVKAGTLAIIKPALFFVPEIGAYVMVGSFTLVPGENMGELGTGCASRRCITNNPLYFLYIFSGNRVVVIASALGAEGHVFESHFPVICFYL